MRVLLLEDDPATSLTLRTALDGAGLTVAYEARTLRGAREAAREDPPDVLVTDIRLPDGEGLTLAEELWAYDRTPSVVISAYADDELTARAAAGGGFAYLLKPVVGREVVAAVRLALARAREARELQSQLTALQSALESRKLVERAKGFLMQAEGLSDEEAYLRLQRHSRDTNTPLAEVARAVIEQHRAPQGDYRGEKKRTDHLRR